MNQISPKVFISYSWDTWNSSRKHENYVLQLANRLRLHGVVCDIDQFYHHTQIPEGWYDWMMNQIEQAKFVLIVCTKNYYLRYRKKVKDDVGLGVKWEGAIITQDLYKNGMLNDKYIPVLFTESGKREYIPEPLQSSTFYWLDEKYFQSSLFDEKYEDLYRHLTNQPNTPKTELGQLLQLPPRERKQDFALPTQNSEPQSQSELTVPLLQIPVKGHEASEVGADYTKLRDLLQAKNFFEANQETARMMLWVTRREKENWLSETDILNFPCRDLGTIDKLWLASSGGKFGFSIQKQIWIAVGGKPGEYDEQTFLRFAEHVKWKVGELWFKEITCNQSGVPGHMPLSVPVPPIIVRGQWYQEPGDIPGTWKYVPVANIQIVNPESLQWLPANYFPPAPTLRCVFPFEDMLAIENVKRYLYLFSRVQICQL